jgi:hypothetical protein
VCSPLHTLGQMASTIRDTCPASQSQERAAAQSKIDYGGHWRHPGVLVRFVYERARRRRSCLYAFVFEHAGCALIESRLGEDLLACWCPRCGEMRIFGTMPGTQAG